MWQARNLNSLHDALREDACASGRYFWAVGATVALDVLACGTSLRGALPRLHGRSVLVAMEDQLATALALIELDGVAARLVLCPPGLSAEHRSCVIAGAGVDAIVSDRDAAHVADCGVALCVTAGRTIAPIEAAALRDQRTVRDQRTIRDQRTEWIMLTSGTSGAPKMVQHSLASLTDAIKPGTRQAAPIWGTFYDIRRFGGLQILLRSILCGGSLVLSDADEPMGVYLERAGSLGVTHISGTPSQWRNALAYSSAARSSAYRPWQGPAAC